MYQKRSFVQKLKQISGRFRSTNPQFNIQTPKTVSQIMNLQLLQFSNRSGHKDMSRGYRPFSQHKILSFQNFNCSIYQPLKGEKERQRFYSSKQKRLLSSQSINFSRYSGQFIRSQSLNNMHKSSRRQLLAKINHRLNQQTCSKHVQLQSSRHEDTFKDHLNSKIDRLQRYLRKIKRQRQMQFVPIVKKKQQNRPINVEFKQKDINKKLNQIENQIGQKKQINQKTQVKSNFQKAFQQLQKIKRQLIAVRRQASQVKQRNSLTKSDKNRIVIKQIVKQNHFKDNYMNTNFRPNSQKYSPIKIIMHNQPQTQQIQKSTIENVHNINMANQSKRVQKPKITFSFNKVNY